METSEGIYHLLFETAAEGLIVSNEKGEIELVNPGATTMFGYTKSELIGQKIELLLPDKYKKNHVQDRESYGQHPQQRSMGAGVTLYAQHKDGREFPVEIGLNAFEQKGRKLFIALVSDITKRKLVENELHELNMLLESKVVSRTKDLEEALKKLQNVNVYLETEIDKRKVAEKKMLAALKKEQELNEMKSRFVAMASHEFRTPLSGIMSSTSLIERYNEQSDQEKIFRHTSRIKSSVQTLTEILNDFLSLEKLETGHIYITPTLFSITEFMDGAMDDIRSLAMAGQEIIYHHEGVEEYVTLDKNVLKVIVNNLTSNALKYSPGGENVEVETLRDDHNLTITITDHGIGIPDQDKKYMFDLFFRAKNTENIGGTGLGLNIVKKHLELLNGTIKFSSQEGTGTTFKVTIPASIN